MARWHEAKKRRNPGTANEYFRRVCRTTHDYLGIEPPALLALPQPELEDAVSKILTSELDRQEGSSAANTLKALKSFLDWHGRDIKRDNEVPDQDYNPNSEGAQIPGQGDYLAVVKAAEPRTRVILSITAQGGQRMRVVGDIEGKNGLRLRDLKELVIRDGRASFTRIPTLVDVPRSLSKNKKPFFFFLGLEACRDITAYLEYRLARGEALGPDSPLVRAEGGQPRFMLRNNTGTSIKTAMANAGVAGYPNLWRSYYANRCQLVEAKGFLEAWRKFFQGHGGNIQTRYANQKGLPADSVEKMRSAYQLALPYLEASPAPVEDPTPQVATVVLRACGLTVEDIAGLDLASKGTEDVVRIMQDALRRKPLPVPEPDSSHPGLVFEPEPLTSAPKPVLPAQGAQASPNAPAAVPEVPVARQRIVSLGELRDALAQGWVFRTMLPGDQAIVEAGA